MSARRTAAAALLCALLAGPSARAQSTPDAQADAWIEDGIRLRAERRDAEALTAFRRAWEATHGAEARGQMALAEQALGSWIDAERDLAAALAEPNHPWVVRHRADLDDALAEIRRHLGSLEVRSATPGARVRINASEPLPLPLAAPARLVVGTARVEVSAEGYTAVRREVEVRAGDDLLETFDLAPAPPAAPVVVPAARVPPALIAPPLVEAPTSPMRAWGVRLLVAGGALAVLGAGSLAWREAAAGEFNAPREPPCDDARASARYGGPLCESLHRQTAAAEALAVTGFVAGGLAAVSGLALLLAAPRAPRGARVACAPGALSVGCAIAF